MIKSLFLVLARLPLPLLHALGFGLGWLVYGLSASYRQKMWDHAEVAFPGQRARQRQAVWGSVAHTGQALFELPFLWGRSTREGAARVTEITGWEHVEQALSAGRGVIVLTPHLGSFESAAQIFSTREPITVLYRPNRKAEVQSIIENSRARDGVGLAPTNLSGVKILLKALKRGQAVGLLPDQVPSNGEGVWAPMFGKPAYTMTLPGRLANATGATVVLALGYRKPWGQGFRLEISPGPQSLSDDPELAATQVNAAMEQLILRHPTQFYWGYERYKGPKQGGNP
ncbi:MAG: lysophospholipid acyltransferase family protein [Limnobacter sp.]|uniref:lysophospholipid acyltransferase family protein n=1 Tax=Limnobacter sp. TaxID=2003368 RepID=UPI00391B4895